MHLIAHKHVPLQLGVGIGRQLDIAIEPEDAPRGLGLQRIVEKVDIPHAGRGILAVFGLGGVDEELLAGGMGAQQGGQFVGDDGLVEEKLDEVGGRGMDVRQEAFGGSLDGVLAAGEEADAGTEGAGNGGVLGGELDEVGETDVALEAECAHLVDDILEPVVLVPGDLVEEDDGAVGAAEVLAGRCEAAGPGAGVVETEADGSAGVVVAAAGSTLEHLRQVLGHVEPSAAGICRTVRGGGFRGGEVGLAGIDAEENVVHGRSDIGDGAVGRTEVADQEGEGRAVVGLGDGAGGCEEGREGGGEKGDEG